MAAQEASWGQVPSRGRCGLTGVPLAGLEDLLPLTTVGSVPCLVRSLHVACNICMAGKSAGTWRAWMWACRCRIGLL